MHTLITLTPNPALDLSGHVKDIIPNEKNYVSRSRLDPGGNGINSARIARRLGLKPRLYGFLGGTAGAELRALLRKEGLDEHFTPIQASTRTNVTVTNEQTHQQTRLTFPGPHVRRQEIDVFFKTLRRIPSQGLLLLGGSIPGGCPNSFYPKVIRLSQRRGLGVALDAPIPILKTTLRGLREKLIFIKPNQTEFEELMGKKFSNPSQIAHAACGLLKKSAVVCISLGKDGVILVWNHRAWLVKAPKVKSLGTVGAGDSFVGAFSAHLVRKKLTHPSDLEQLSSSSKEFSELLEAARWGVAAGAATASTEGTSLGKASTIRKLFPKTQVQSIF